MTCYFDPEGGTMDVFDHEETLIASDVPYGTNDAEDNGVWEGDFPNKVYDVLRESMDSSAPSAYNQILLADMASDNIERGTPPA